MQYLTGDRDFGGGIEIADGFLLVDAAFEEGAEGGGDG